MTSEEYQMFMGCMREIRDAIDRNTASIDNCTHILFERLDNLQNIGVSIIPD
jgi:hypothetical protein